MKEVVVLLLLIEVVIKFLLVLLDSICRLLT
jgi:hypothetical protein